MNYPMRSLAFSLFGAVFLPAQTFIVDAAGGAGSSFLSIAAAANAVPDGATLLVRAGHYSGFSLAAKGLTILGESGVVIDQTGPVVTITGQAATQPVVLAGLRFADAWLSLQSCSGPVRVEDCAPESFQHFLRLGIDQCLQVHLGRCTFDGSSFGWAAQVSQSDVVAVDCDFRCFGGSPAIDLVGGQAQLARCQVLGGNGPNAAGIRMNGGSLRLVGPGSVGCVSPTAPAIGGVGSVRVNDATIAWVGQPAAPGIAMTLVDDATTSTSPVTVGGTATGTLEGLSGDLGALLFGSTAMPSVVPGFAEELWLDLAGLQIAAVGVVQGSTPVTLSFVVPANPLLLGLRFGWQGLTLDPQRGFVLSNPAWFIPR